jgi:hypothetical protein
MPWWLNLYLIGFASFTVFRVHTRLRKSGPYFLLVASLVCDACMVLVALGFWFQQVRSLLGNAAIIIFVAVLAWIVVATTRDIRNALPIRKLSVLLNALAAALATLLYFMIYGPFLYWGFLYAVLGRAGGT